MQAFVIPLRCSGTPGNSLGEGVEILYAKACQGDIM